MARSTFPGPYTSVEITQILKLTIQLMVSIEIDPSLRFEEVDGAIS